MNIIQGFPVIKKGKYKVCVQSYTYNHAAYIEACMRGVAMQETTFPFVQLIVDDFSTDGEQNVIRTYIFSECNMSKIELYDNDICNIIVAEHKDNVNCTMVAYMLKKNMYGNTKKDDLCDQWKNSCKYVSMCEGDDYWIAPRKLQMQVDYMELNPTVGLCYTDFNHYTEDDCKTQESCFANGIMVRSLSFEEHLLNAGYIAPMTWMWRSSFNQMLKRCYIKTDGTFAYALDFFKQSKVAFLPVATATYRTHVGSASNPSTIAEYFRQYKGVFDTQMFYAKKYNVSQSLIDNIKSKNYFNLLPYAVKMADTEFLAEAESFFLSKNIHFNTLVQQVNKLISQQVEIKHIIRDYNIVSNSKAYKIGTILLRPLKFVRKILPLRYV